MKIEKQQNDNQIILLLDGELDSTQAKSLEEAITNIPEGITELVLDLAKLNYTASAGLRTFLLANKIMKEKNGELKIINVNSNVYEILRIASLIDVLKPEKI